MMADQELDAKPDIPRIPPMCAPVISALFWQEYSWVSFVKVDSGSVLLLEQKPKIPPAILAFRMIVLLTHCRNRTFWVVFPQIPPTSEVRVASRISPSELQLVKVSY